MASGKYPRDHVEQAVVQPLLIFRELDGERFGLAGSELSNVPPPRPIDQGAERVEFFDGLGETNPLGIQELILKPVANV